MKRQGGRKWEEAKACRLVGKHAVDLLFGRDLSPTCPTRARHERLENSKEQKKQERTRGRDEERVVSKMIKEDSESWNSKTGAENVYEHSEEHRYGCKLRNAVKRR